MRLLPTLFLTVSLLGVTAVHAHFSLPEEAPTAKLLALASKGVERQPNDARAHYTLARVHYFAFATGAKTLAVYLPRGEDRSLDVAPQERFTSLGENARYHEAKRRVLAELGRKEAPRYDTPEYQAYDEKLKAVEARLSTEGWVPATEQPEATAAAHLTRAAEEFQTTLRLDPKLALARIGYASLLEDAGAWIKQHPAASVPPAIRDATLTTILDAYRDAWQAEVAADLAHKEGRGTLGPYEMISYEAAQAYLRLAKANPAALTRDERKTADEMKRSSAKEERGPFAITPIVFCLRATPSFRELLAPEATVTFPLRGYGPAGSWPWVRPETALLVWNPSGSGRIASGAQLFGGYTWEQFWPTGYEPLAVLDADGDGQLTGPELAGLAAWFDVNGNGVADPGEVHPLAELGVVALTTRATGCVEGNVPTNPHGITFADGRVLPTWDWLVEEK